MILSKVSDCYAVKALLLRKGIEQGTAALIEPEKAAYPHIPFIILHEAAYWQVRKA